MRAASRVASRALGAAAALAVTLPLASASASPAAPLPLPRPLSPPSLAPSPPSPAKNGLLPVGSGTRIRYGFVRVYDATLFVDGGVRAFADGAAALRAVQDGKVAAHLSIRLLRGAAASTLSEAIEAAVAPHVRARGVRDARDATGDLAKLAELGPCLAAALGAELPEGTELGFAWEGAGDLSVSVNGSPVVRFAEAPLLCGGFFATYVDERAPLIPAARAAWIAGIEEIQQRQQQQRVQ
jgi:hypothetical protein